MSAYVARVADNERAAIDLMAGLRLSGLILDYAIPRAASPKPRFERNLGRSGDRCTHAYCARRIAVRNCSFADIGGGGDSDLTWQLFASLGYQLSLRWSVQGGWRYFSAEKEITAGMSRPTSTAPLLGFTARFPDAPPRDHPAPVPSVGSVPARSRRIRPTSLNENSYRGNANGRSTPSHAHSPRRHRNSGTAGAESPSDTGSDHALYEHFDPQGKPPSKFTIELHERLAQARCRSRTSATSRRPKKGFIAAPPYKQIMAEAGQRGLGHGQLRVPAAGQGLRQRSIPRCSAQADPQHGLRPLRSRARADLPGARLRPRQHHASSRAIPAGSCSTR
ncbi:MAG: hypothetical protein MZV49_06780 [Rhodopseudomonas palustris]|nr:hypothetical protein [Rhodopseudomonas palustris]